MRNRILLFLILFSFLNISLSDIPGCDAGDQAVLLQLKDYIKGPALSDWDPDTNCCYWNYIGCIERPGPTYGRVDAVTIGGGSGVVGQIPEVIGNLPYLVEIMFEEEPKLTGPLPQSLSKLKHLQIIYLSSNSLTGPIPSFLGKLKQLTEVDLSGNHFTGVIPASLSKLPKLESFNASHNKLTGSIPNWQLKKLTSFDVSFNQLCGPIPTGLKKFGKTSFGHNKCLCGPPLSACKKSMAI